jgi:hypothetical protein
MISHGEPRTATTVAGNHPHLCMNLWSLSRQNATELCFRSHKIEVSRETKKRIFFYLALHLVLKERKKSVMEEGEVSKPFNITRRLENKLNISLYKEHIVGVACQTTKTLYI